MAKKSIFGLKTLRKMTKIVIFLETPLEVELSAKIDVFELLVKNKNIPIFL